MNWLVLVFISAITGSLVRIFQKILLRNKDSDPFAFGFIFQISIALLFLIYTLSTHSLKIPNLSGLEINLIIMILFYSLGNLFVFQSFKFAQASEISVILASSTVWTVITALFVFKETLTLTKIIGIILVILGIGIINLSKTKWKFNKGHIFALSAALLFGIAFTNDVFLINHFENTSSYMTVAFSIPAVFILLYHPKSVKNIPSYFDKKILFKLLICGFLCAVSAITIYEACKAGGEVSIVSPISQSSIIFTVIFGYFFLKEKDRLLNKLLGAIFAFIGVLFLI